MSNKDFENNADTFEFDLPDWEKGENAAAASGGPKAAEGFSADFSASSFDLDKEAEVEEGFESFGGFGAMPTQESHSSENNKGNPDAEFGDFGVSNDAPEPDFAHEEEPSFDQFEQTFARQDDAPAQFGSYDDTLVHQTTDFDDAQDVLQNGDYLHNGTGTFNPYEDVPEEQEPVVADASTAAAKPLFAKLIVPVGIAAVLGIGGFMGYSALMSSTSPSSPVVIADHKVNNEPAFPNGLPTIDTAQGNVPAKPATPAIATSNQPGVDVGNLNGDLKINLPGQTPSPQPLAADTKLPASAATQPADTQPSLFPTGNVASGSGTPEKVVPTEVAVDTSKFVSKDDFDALVSRIDAIQNDVASVRKLAESFNNQVAAPVQPVAVKTPEILPGLDVDAGGLNPNATPVASFDSVTPPLKPIIINGIALKGVSRDVAWIKAGTSDTIEVRVGDDLPKGGKVVSIRNYRGDWIVVTSEGIIVR
jgi:hypothetical protein